MPRRSSASSTKGKCVEMVLTCDKPCVPCPEDAAPISNVSAERIDAQFFLSGVMGFFGSIIGDPFAPPDASVYQPPRSYPPGTGGTNPPALGSSWTSQACGGYYTSTISQEDADLHAAAYAAQCVGDANQKPVYFNSAQTKSITCPDGSVFSYTAEAGKFKSAKSQVDANNIAASFAQGKVNLLVICLGGLANNKCCNGSAYSATVSALPVKSYSWSVSGNLPPGITYDPSLQEQVNVNQILFTGTPTEAGSFTFTITATSKDADQKTLATVSKAYTINVYGIADASDLTDANCGNFYSHTFIPEGPVISPFSWTVVAGSLPPGLTLAAGTGYLSGTPTSEGAYQFTIKMEDSTP